MTKFDDIYDVAVDNYGLVTTAQAAGLGVTRSELRRYSTDGRLEHRGHGLYRLVRWVPTPQDRFAEAVALVGEGSCLFGESVLALLGLASVNPARLTIATPLRVRRELPPWVEVVHAADVGRLRAYFGIPSQHAADAIIASRGRVVDERLSQAASEARREGWIAAEEERGLVEVLRAAY